MRGDGGREGAAGFGEDVILGRLSVCPLVGVGTECWTLRARVDLCVDKAGGQFLLGLRRVGRLRMESLPPKKTSQHL